MLVEYSPLKKDDGEINISPNPLIGIHTINQSVDPQVLPFHIMDIREFD